MSITVLIVDDEPRMTRPVDRLLRRHGCESIICPTIYEARTYIQETPPDLIILDIKFPGNDRAGVEFLAELKSDDNPARDIPVVMLTVRGEPEIEQECLELGAAAYIRKMAATKEIIGVVEKCLGLKPNSLQSNFLEDSSDNFTRNIISNVRGLRYAFRTADNYS